MIIRFISSAHFFFLPCSAFRLAAITHRMLSACVLSILSCRYIIPIPRATSQLLGVNTSSLFNFSNPFVFFPTTNFDSVNSTRFTFHDDLVPAALVP